MAGYNAAKVNFDAAERELNIVRAAVEQLIDQQSQSLESLLMSIEIAMESTQPETRHDAT
jgi:hypothetical protein